MSNLPSTINKFDNLIHNLQKTESTLRVGHIPDAWRETNRIISCVSQDDAFDVDGKDNYLRQLYKISSKINMGQIVPAWRELNQIISLLKTARQKLIEKIDKKEE